MHTTPLRDLGGTHSPAQARHEGGAGRAAGPCCTFKRVYVDYIGKDKGHKGFGVQGLRLRV